MFVIDSTLRNPLDIAPVSKDFFEVISKDEYKDKLFLFLANKQDLEGAMSAKEVIDAYRMNELPINKDNWHIQETSAVTGAGLYEALEWIVDTLAKRG